MQTGMWEELLGDALRSPSPHNVQPWRVRLVDAHHAELHVQKSRTLPDEDVTGSFIILTMGLFLEALRLAAAHRGLALEEDPVQGLETFSPDRLRNHREDLLPFTRLTLRRSSDVIPEFPIELLRQRRTSRLPYDPEPVSEESAARLEALAMQARHRYIQVTEPSSIERILSLNVDAVFQDLNHPPYRNELRAWLRYSASQAKRHRDGLEARCMNQSPIELWSAFHLPALMRWPITRRYFLRRYRDQIGPVGTMGFLCGPFWDPGVALQNGRLLLHFWLECTRLGYFIHPYGNLVTNRPTAARLEREIGASDVWLAFKIGRSRVPPESLRRSLEEVLVD